MLIIQIETLHTLSIPIFASTCFSELKKSYFVSTYFFQMVSFWEFRVDKFHPHRKKNKKKTFESRDMRLIFYQDQWKDRLRWKNLLIYSKNELTNIFCAYLCVCVCVCVWVFIFRKSEFFVSLACIYFRKCRLKENFVCI